jgi:hypothetical protein
LIPTSKSRAAARDLRRHSTKGNGAFGQDAT